jgi:hypothetical protein
MLHDFPRRIALAKASNLFSAVAKVEKKIGSGFKYVANLLGDYLDLYWLCHREC